ncbi:MAG: hypothetical protein NTW15_20925 [Burkholderiales bacterium]|nr:hypothetical protein [Burkholderiales bacterium]
MTRCIDLRVESLRQRGDVRALLLGPHRLDRRGDRTLQPPVPAGTPSLRILEPVAAAAAVDPGHSAPPTRHDPQAAP